MDADSATTPLGAWASIRGYFTPSTLFLVLNLVIGTIALTSRSRDQRRRREHHHDYAHHQGHYQEPLNDPHHHQQEYNYYATPPPPPAPLARTSSVLDRFRSIGLYRFRSGDFPPEYGTTAAANHHDAFAPVEEEDTTKQYARSRSEPAPAREERTRTPPQPRVKKSQAAQAPAATVVEAVAEDATAEEFIGGLMRQHEPPSPPQKAEHLPYQEEEYAPPPAPMRAPPPLSRTSSVLDRLRSLGLYSFLAAEQPEAAAPTPATTDDKKQAATAQAHYDRSRSEPAREQGKKEKKQAAEARMAKSSSSTTARKAAAAGPSLVSEEDCVDARAEAFIDSFRKGQSQKQVHHDEDDDEHVVPPPPAPLARTSSVLDRLRSFSLYLRSGDPVPEDPVNKASTGADEKTKQAARYGRSRSEPAQEQGKKKKAQGMSKTSSEANVAEEAPAPAEECVDARADDFINKFRQQLQLQRLNSLLNYKEVLNRGGSKQ